MKSSEFPSNGLIGQNILDEKLDTLTSGVHYSMHAVTKQANLTILIRKLQGDVWLLDVFNNQGWMSSRYNDQNGEQTFKMGSNSKADLDIHFPGHGSAVIEYYENGEAQPFHKRNITW